MANLTFSDDFNSLNFWNAQYAPNGVWRDNYGYGGINNYKLGSEIQLYTGPYFDGHPGDFNDGNYQLSNGVLSLVAHQTTNSEVLGMGYNYTSAMITTRGLEPWFGGPSSQFSQEYGYFEMRADLSDEPGAWNAFWLLPAGGTSSGWNYAETDIVESVGKENGAVWQAVHGATEAGQYAPGVNVAGDGFHTFGLDWTATTMTWYVDGVATYSIATPTDMHQPMTIFANLAVGGPWAGTPNFGSDGQAAMKIDYIKVWDSNPYVSAPAPAVTTVPPVVYVGADQSILEGDSGTSNIVFTLTRTGDLSGSTSMNWSTDIGGGGTNVPDLNDVSGPISGTVTFAPGESAKQIAIAVNGDTTVETDEVFHLSVSNLSGGTIGDDGVAVGTIRNDDTAIATVLGRVILGTKHADYLEGGAGNDTLTGSQGSDTFGFHAGDGHDVVTDFSASKRGGDHVDLSGAHYQLTQSGSGALITLDTGDTLLLQNLTVKQLQASNWLF